MLSKRQIKLLKTLQSFNDYQDIKNISIVLGVSQRTVHNEIKVLKTNGIPIISKRGKGIKLIKQNINYDYLLDFELEGVLARRIEIIYNLIFEKKFITFLGLSEKYYTSTTSIKYDIAFIEEKICKDSKAILKSSRSGTKMIFSNTEQMIKVFLNFNDLIL